MLGAQVRAHVWSGDSVTVSSVRWGDGHYTDGRQALRAQAVAT